MDLFTNTDQLFKEQIGPASTLLHGFALAEQTALLAAIDAVAAQAPFRHMLTPGGQKMSAAMTNCGPLGWVSDRKGYRYDACDPHTAEPWPTMPEIFTRLAHGAALEAGFADFKPDACLINRYEASARMGLHQDRDEQDMSQPIVSISLGIPAVFQFGGLQRSDKVVRLQLVHGDVLVWGGVDRLRFHGVLPVKAAQHALLGNYRINLTFRRAQ